MYRHHLQGKEDDDRHVAEYIAEHIKKGTTTCALTCNDGVVLAADTRASAGYFIADRHAMKIHKVDRHLGMTIAGGVADAQNLIDIMRYNANIYRLTNKELMPVKSAARVCSNVLFNQRYFPYYVQLILAGVDGDDDNDNNDNNNNNNNNNNKNAKDGQIYNIDLFGSLTSEKFISTGSGSPVAYGYLESEFREGLSVNDAYKTAIQAIAAAIRRNAGTGDNINAVIIDKDGYRELSREMKEAVSAIY
jgi:proteasome beta subunit